MARTTKTANAAGEAPAEADTRMPGADPSAQTAPSAAAETAGGAPVALPRARMGVQIGVVAGAGRVVINREFGGRYSETVVSPATVNLRIRRLLDDGDLVQRPLSV